MKIIKKIKEFLNVVENPKVDMSIGMENMPPMDHLDLSTSKLIPTSDNTNNGLKFTRISQLLKGKDGKELWKTVGHNALLLGGAQNIIDNTYYNISRADLTEITPLDREPGMNIEATNVKYTSDKRVIFGYGLVNDGVVGLNEAPVMKWQKGYNIEHLLGFQAINLADDDPVEMHKTYAMRHVDTANNYAIYYAKKMQINLENITTNGMKLPNNPHDSYSGKLDISSRVYFDINIDKNEMMKWFGIKYGTKQGALLNGIVLFAGRPCEVTINGTVINTFRDVIVTNRVNISDVTLGNTELTYKYELFYV